MRNFADKTKQKMNVIFITLSSINGLQEHGIYADLMRKFRDEGHQVYIISPSERRNGQPTQLLETDGATILTVRTLNIQKTNVVEKGLGTLLIEEQFKHAIKKRLGNVRFDLILYSTPPITFTNVVRYLKRENPTAMSYLLLKDIFPQNAVDIGMFGSKSLFHRYFRRKERALYQASDYIGCMSPANVEYIRRHNPDYPADHVEVAPNSIELKNKNEKLKGEGEHETIRQKYGLPTDRPIFIYGGNLGRPQGIPFLIECLEANKERQDCHFLIVGNGTEYRRLAAWHAANPDGNTTLLQRLPKEDYDQLAEACDVGMIFLDHRFTIPNYPSRLLAYLQSAMPVLCATDPNTDIGRIAQDNGYGLWCESNDVAAFTQLIDHFTQHPGQIPEMGRRGYEFLKANYLVDNTYQAITHHL